MRPELLRRPDESGDRIFPLISKSLYDPVDGESRLSVDQSAAIHLLVTLTRRLTRLQVYLGWRLSATERLAHLLVIHRQALHSEQAAQCRRADFFWQEVYRRLQSILTSEEVWAATADLIRSDINVATE